MLVKEYGMEAAQGAFEQTVRELGVEMNHDVLGCCDCHWEGRDKIYCRCSCCFVALLLPYASYSTLRLFTCVYTC